MKKYKYQKPTITIIDVNESVICTSGEDYSNYNKKSSKSWEVEVTDFKW